MDELKEQVTELIENASESVAHIATEIATVAVMEVDRATVGDAVLAVGAVVVDLLTSD